MQMRLYTCVGIDVQTIHGDVTTAVLQEETAVRVADSDIFYPAVSAARQGDPVVALTLVSLVVRPLMFRKLDGKVFNAYFFSVSPDDTVRPVIAVDALMPARQA